MKRINKKAPSHIWSQTTPDKQIRHFNQSSSQGRGKIVINPETWVEYDYNVHPPNMVLKNKASQTDSNQQPEPPKETFTIGKYPILRKIVDQMPKESTHKESTHKESTHKESTHKESTHKDMDLYLVRNMEATFLWKNGGFEISN